jgi:hypothetical protein
MKTTMDINALQLISRFSFSPNNLGYCGRKEAMDVFKQCIIYNSCEKVKKEAKHFIVLYPYLKTIAEITKKPIFSYQVLEAYWIGNNLLKKAKLKHYNLLLLNFAKQGVPHFFIKELKNKRPREFIPHHLFQVLHVGVGRASGSVPFNLNSINNCMVRWGRVLEIKQNKTVIDLNSLEKRKRKYQLVVKKETINFDSNFIPNLKIGSVVAVHWKKAVKILTADEEKNLIFWTRKIIDNNR